MKVTLSSCPKCAARHVACEAGQGYHPTILLLCCPECGGYFLIDKPSIWEAYVP